MSNTVHGNPIEALVTQFRTVTNDLEVLVADSELAEKVKANRKIQRMVSDLGDLLEQHKVEVSEEFGKEMAKIYEAMVLGEQDEVGDEQLKRKVEAAAELAEDYGIDRVEIDGLVERYNTAKDKFLDLVGNKVSGKGTKYGNTLDSYTSNSVRGVKRHLTVTFGKEHGGKVVDTETGEEVTD